jgi:hypothetical protein
VSLLPYDPEVLSLSTTPDARVLLFTTAVTLATAVVFGHLPAFRGSRVQAAATLKGRLMSRSSAIFETPGTTTCA